MSIDSKILGLSYLATPYSKYAGGPEQAFIAAAQLAAKLMQAGVKVYSPIAHTHPLAIYGGIDPLDHAIWMPFDEAMMSVAQSLIVAHLDGWDTSFGIAEEVKFFEAAGKPIFDLYPQTLMMVRRRCPPEARVTDVRSVAASPHLNQPQLAHNKTPSLQGGSSA